MVPGLLHEFKLKPSTIISGGAQGVDTGAEWAADKMDINFVLFLPDYNKYHKRKAPLMRNIEMAEAGDVLLAIWDGKSGGTQHMMSQMRKRNKPIYLVTLSSETEE
jgi:hypothetical protein